MLKVVQDEQQRFPEQVMNELNIGVFRTIEGNLKCARNRRSNQIRRSDAGQGYEIDAVGKAAKLLGGGLQGQARLADAARSDQRQQPAVRIIKPLRNLC